MHILNRVHTRSAAIRICLAFVVLVAVPAGAWGASYLGTAADYAVFGLYTPPSGTSVNLGNVTVGSLVIRGDVAVGPYGTCSFMAPSEVYGNIYRHYVGPSAAQNAKGSGPGVFMGGTWVNRDLTQANADALWAYNDALSRTATQTFGSITGSQTVVGNGGINVISIASITLNDNQNLLFSGGLNDFFIVNVTGGLTMGGNGTIGGAGSVDASKILLNFIGTGTELKSHVNNVLNGTVLAPYRSVEFHSANGAVLAGGANLTLMSGCTINYVPLTSYYVPPQPAVPEPSALLLALLGGVSAFGGRLIRKRR